MTLPPIDRDRARRGKRLSSRKHRDWIANHLCVAYHLGNCYGPVDCCHARGVVPPSERGIGIKPSDIWCFSACRKHHRESEKREAEWGKENALDVRALCLEFARSSPDVAIRQAAKEIKS